MTIEVIEPVIDPRSARQVARDTRKHEEMARRRLSSKGATIAAIVIAFFWTIPTFGLFVTSFRPAERHADDGVVDGLHRPRTSRSRTTRSRSPRAARR